ncbi:ABC-2 transporter permease [Clostridium sp. ATCC 25772]|uniref:ABC-2 transporter permease n=1 Tax=Clostridium sp. ATCC 25772 TaxID=1676991 RepID=UPI000785BFCA|nr:ABC-2 transporter permease [Clostridium sp. ATCC 25772]
MLNVIKRDLKIQLLSLKGSQFIVLLISMTVIAMTQGQDFINYLIMVFVIGGLSYTELENRDGVYKSTLSYPCTRKDYVLGKFIASIVVAMIGCIVSIILNEILLIAIPTKFAGVNIHSLKSILLYSLVILSMYYFSYFSLGIKAAKISYYVTLVVFMIGFMFINNIFKFNQGNITKFISNTSIQFNIILIMGVLAITGILATLSVVIYEKRDL